ncbi:MAG: YceI family protein [Pseudomonadota bacterium]
MTNYFVVLTATAALCAGACSAADTPAAARPKPAPTSAVAAQPAAAAARYVQAPAGSTLTFTFVQEGAANNGSFKRFTTELTYDEKDPATGSLKVQVQIASVDTQDKERNEMISGSDLFDAQKFPTAQYVANSFAKRADGTLEAVGKLTLRGTTHDLRLPLKIVATAAGAELSGTATIKRLDYGVGQGDWKSTESVGDEVKLQYQVALVKAK